MTAHHLMGTVVAETNIYNVPEKIHCKNCFAYKAYRNSDVEISDNRKYFRNWRGKLEYEEDYKCTYRCEYCNTEFTCIVKLRE